MKSSPLRLEKYWLRSITVSENPAFDPNSTGIPIFQTTTNRGYKADDRKIWKVDLQVKTTENCEPFQPYNIVIEMSGIFHIPDSLPEIDWDTIIAVNAPAMLFGACRELVAFVTGRGFFPATILPLVTFIDEAPQSMASSEPKKKKS